MLIYRVMRDDGSMLAYKIAMRQLDRVEEKLRQLRHESYHGLYRKAHEHGNVSRLVQVAIDRAVGKRIRLVTNWWKEHE